MVESPLPAASVTAFRVMSTPPRRALPLRHRSYGLMRQTTTLHLDFVSPLILGGLCRLLPAPAGQWPPGRPEESHHQSPTDPDVNVSAHPARASRSHTASRRYTDTK